MSQNQRFKEFVDEGVRSVAAKQNRSVKAVELSLAEATGYSRSTVQHWRRGYSPADLETLTLVARYFVENGQLPTHWARQLLKQGGHPNPEQIIIENRILQESRPLRIFVCYARGTEPDQTVAISIAQALNQEHVVFFDQISDSGEWVNAIESELVSCDILIALLSSESVTNEIVLAEIDRAWRSQEERGVPRLIPVRINYPQTLGSPFHVYFEGLRTLLWQSMDDTSSLIKQLQNIIERRSAVSLEKSPTITPIPLPDIMPPSPATRQIPLEMPEGTIDIESRFYVIRKADQIALSAIQNKGVTITIKGSRQMGKSSLLIRVADAAQQVGKQVVFIDFQLLSSSYDDADEFFQQFCRILSYQLQLPDNSERYWQIPLTNAFRCTNYVLKELLEKLEQPFVLAMDEVDSIFDTSFRTEFFGMLRSWHNNRALQSAWKKLDLALVTSTEPYYFVQSLAQSPFNVGEIVDLVGFTHDQVDFLNKQHDSPFSEQDLNELMDLLNGHPYLVRRALYLVATKRFSVSQILSQTTDEEGPFGDHLRSLLLKLNQNKLHLEGLVKVLQTGQCEEDLFFRLRGMGLIKREAGRILPSCQLYAHFFQTQFNDATK